MHNHYFITLSIADGTEMDTYIDLLIKKGYPGIIFQEALGVNRHICNIVERPCKVG
ncbi:hypothetical protein [Ilyomonas limi]|uniref:hypothetical protein n=1 Tax=Ilyomonas limi TaxID=2575867 RepID=UPI001485BDF4|nr:hypothetical protein [Ilyomonas limi]